MTRLMIWVQHLLGTGHLERMRRIAEAASDAGFDVHFVTGGVPIPGRMPRDVTLVQLPPIRVADDSFSPLRDAGYRPIDEDYRQARVAKLLAAYERAAPSVVLFETFPFGRRGLRFELFPLLERIEATRPRPAVVASIRDILQVQEKAGRVGFDWKDPRAVLAKIREEADEIEAELDHGVASRRAAEVGDLLFAVVNLARHLSVDPEGALRRTNAKFERRFRSVEAALAVRGKTPSEASLDEMEALWVAAKKQERASG